MGEIWEPVIIGALGPYLSRFLIMKTETTLVLGHCQLAFLSPTTKSTVTDPITLTIEAAVLTSKEDDLG